MAYHVGQLTVTEEIAVLSQLVHRIEDLSNVFVDEYNTPDDDESVDRAVAYLSDRFGPWVEDFYYDLVLKKKDANSRNG